MATNRTTLRDYYPSGKLRLESEINRQGVPDGTCREYFENGQLKALSSRSDGVLDGPFQQWREDGKLLGEFKFNAGNGTYRHWHDNGTIGLETEYRDGIQHGSSKVYDPDSGKCVLTQYFLKGKKVSKKAWLNSERLS
jgi:uncharacterized protein